MRAKLLILLASLLFLSCKTVEQRLCPPNHQLCLDEELGSDGSFFRCVPVGEACHKPPQTIPSPSPSPEPEPSATPIPEPTPSPTPVPTPTPSPSPSPTPVPSPTPTPSGAPPLTESGNFPVLSFCPAWFANAVSEVGISVLTQRKCMGRDAPPDCTLTVMSATEKSVKPFCEHSCYDEAGRYSLANCRNKCETVRVCQQPEFVNGNGGIKMLISSPEWGNVFGDCDKQTAEGPFPDNRRNFLCHDRAENRGGVTQAKACEPDGSKCGPVATYRSLP